MTKYIKSQFRDDDIIVYWADEELGWDRLAIERTLIKDRFFNTYAWFCHKTRVDLGFASNEEFIKFITAIVNQRSHPEIPFPVEYKLWKLEQTVLELQKAASQEVTLNVATDDNTKVEIIRSRAHVFDYVPDNKGDRISFMVADRQTKEGYVIIKARTENGREATVELTKHAYNDNPMNTIQYITNALLSSLTK